MTVLRRWRSTLPIAACLTGFALALVLRPQEAAAGARDGLVLFGETVLPALFPFLVLSSLVVELGYAERLGRRLSPVMGPLFGVGGAGASALLLGLIGGYPLGVRTVAQLYKRGSLSRTEAERLLLFCNNSGPAFLLGVVGAGTLGSPKAGLLLLGTHVIGALCCGLLAPFLCPGKMDKKQPSARDGALSAPPAFSTAFTEAMGGAIHSSLNVCACVVLFGVILRLLRLLGVLQATALLDRLGLPAACGEALLSGLVELTNGIAALPHNTGIGTMLVAAFLLGFGGLSVFCQTSAMLSGSGLSPLWCLKGQLLHGVLSALLTVLAMRAFPDAVQTISAAAVPLAGMQLSALLPPLTGLGAWGGVLAAYGAWRKRRSPRPNFYRHPFPWKKG